MSPTLPAKNQKKFFLVILIIFEKSNSKMAIKSKPLDGFGRPTAQIAQGIALYHLRAKSRKSEIGRFRVREYRNNGPNTKPI